MIGVFLSFLIAVLSWVALNRPENYEYRLGIMVFIVVGLLFGVILTLEHFGVLPLFKGEKENVDLRNLEVPKFDYTCEILQAIADSDLSETDRNEMIKKIERACCTYPYKFFSKENYEYIKRRLDNVRQSH